VNLTELGVVELRDAVRSKKISALEATRHFVKRIESIDKKINSFISVNERAEIEAEAIDRRLQAGEDPGPLAGVPIAVKDLLCTKGLQTTAGSNILRGFIPPYSATVVERLQRAGAVVIGKTNLDEFAMGSSNETSAYEICRNPWNPEYVPGGSSGGSAAALAARLAPGAIGTDTGGSIRQPASFCGVVGIKPTYGRVSRYGIIAFASSLDQAGPMAHSSVDCAAILEAISGHDPHDATSSAQPVPQWSQKISKGIKGKKIGLLKEAMSDKVDADTISVINRAANTLKAQGAEIVEVSIPMLHYAVSIYYLIATSEASSNLARYDGVRYGPRSQRKSQDLDEFYARNRAEGFGAEVKRRIMLGTYALSSGYYDAYYVKASQVRRMMRDQYLAAFAKCDAILSPVTTSPAFRIGERVSDPLEMYLNDIFTTSTNLAGLPGMSVPGGFSKSGLPIGVQLTGRHFDEQILFDLGAALEEGLQVEKRVPNVI